MIVETVRDVALTVGSVGISFQALHDSRVGIETRFTQFVEVLDHIEVVLQQTTQTCASPFTVNL